ncbi:MAG TPA: MBL fold metallo-hydrolase, partial [Chitinophagaceae bacterium]|nr:MBL fold metallo-hydrolase [Chitinophagaceae bacterium]
LVDVGVTCKEIEIRMARLGLSMQKVKGIFISHEHSDHIKGVAVLSKKYNLPVYITTATLRQGRLYLDRNLVRSFSSAGPVFIGSLSINAFSKLHDAADPYSFTVSCNDVRVGIFTDIGTPCDGLVQHFSQCHAAFLESNYDEDMLEKGSYPYYLKNRIRGERGHLSNTQALEVFTKHRPSFMSHLFLSHLSKNNNCPKLVTELFASHARGTKIVVASRYKETEIYPIYSQTKFDPPQFFPPKKAQLEFAF